MSKPRKDIAYLSVDRKQLKKEDYTVYSEGELSKMMLEIINNKVNGLSFSPYLDDQDPSTKSKITQKQIADRLEIIRPYTKWIRTFSCTNGNEEVPRIAHEKGLKTLVGTWIGDDLEENEKELANAIRIAKAGYVDILAIGNEVLLRKDLEIEQLIDYIKRVKRELPNVMIGYVDAYYMFVNYPEIIEECDLILANCYPFWEYCSVETSLDYMKHMYALVSEYTNGKKVIISETGWPSKGQQYGDAIPSFENAMSYFIQTQKWANEMGIETFYFSSFDEVWKINHEGEYGAYWGIWDKDGNYKFIK